MRVPSSPPARECPLGPGPDLCCVSRPDLRLVCLRVRSNTVVFSDPKSETAPPTASEVVQTSNRRFRQEEFLLPAALTKDSESMSVRMRYVQVDTELFPGRPFAQHGWTELEYSVYCFVEPPPLAEMA